MKIFDVSMRVNYDMPVYKNRDEKRPLIKTVRDFSTGNVYESRMDIEMHTGTHVDAPLHMVEGGGTIESIDLNRVVTRCRVFDLTGVADGIGGKDLEGRGIKKDDFLIFKTRNSYEEYFNEKYVYLKEDGAVYLKKAGIKGVGTDALGIERDQPGHPTHKILLEAEIVILEGLRLKDVDEGEYLLVAAPLKLTGVEASPVRAVLIRD